MQRTHTPIHKNIAITVQFNTSHQVSTRNSNKNQSSSKQNNSTSKVQGIIIIPVVKNLYQISITLHTGKSKKCIENRETVKNTDKDHTKIKIITEKKRVPDNIFLITNKKQRKNIRSINKDSTIKEISKKSKNTKSRKGRFKKVIIPSDDPT